MTDKPSPAPIQQNQAWPDRSGVMDALIKAAFTSPISALEIGVWFGVGSTNIWLTNLKPGSSILLLDSWKPYSSQEDLQDDGWNYKQMDDLSTDAFLSAFLNIKRFENENADKKIRIQLTRGDSSSFLPLLQANAFDFIYIDGDHKYEKVKADIQQAKRLVRKNFGVICGDDLDKLPTPDLIEVSRKHTNRDALREEGFHPGVLLAVAEEFESVNMRNSFWWTVCKDGAFTTEILKPS